ncbi:MAG: hypothetical protein GVY29_06310 [Spirochaetes bacterium]|jgi:ABC-type multidrug transport system ATPase subunit|nr:hypothetical protein [Spirochaetota bacterium]
MLTVENVARSYGELKAVDGIDPRSDSRGVKSIVGYVSEEAILYSSMTPRDVFELVVSVRSLDQDVANHRIHRYLDAFDAGEILEKPMATLSRGQRQKIEIVAALRDGASGAGSRLEDVFLRLTDQEGSIGDIVAGLREADR